MSEPLFYSLHQQGLHAVAVIINARQILIYISAGKEFNQNQMHIRVRLNSLLVQQYFSYILGSFSRKGHIYGLLYWKKREKSIGKQGSILACDGKRRVSSRSIYSGSTN